MMISPEMFADEYRNDSIEEIIEIRDELINDIKDLEKIVFDKERNTESWWRACENPTICPNLLFFWKHTSIFHRSPPYIL